LGMDVRELAGEGRLELEARRKPSVPEQKVRPDEARLLVRVNLIADVKTS
jgi:hypothetical protein